ncbi:MAG TPA: hypothetical protein VGB79_01825 [Allosphingosinicella sp.]|jgi:hypothetical protein
MNKCRHCNVDLVVGVNWYKSFCTPKWVNRLCRKCADKKAAEYRPAHEARYPEKVKAARAARHKRRYADPEKRERLRRQTRENYRRRKAARLATPTLPPPKEP